MKDIAKMRDVELDKALAEELMRLFVSYTDDTCTKIKNAFNGIMRIDDWCPSQCHDHVYLCIEKVDWLSYFMVMTEMPGITSIHNEGYLMEAFFKASPRTKAEVCLKVCRSK